MQRSEIRSKVYTRVVTTESDPLLTPTVVNDLINDALREISSDGEWTWLNLTETIECVANSATYALPAGFIEVISLTNSNGQQLTPINEADLEAINAATFGEPLFFVVGNKQLTVTPVPTYDLDLSLRYKSADNTLTGDADEPKLPEHLVDALIWYTCYLCMIVTRDDQRASDMYNAYQLARKRMETQPTQVSPIPRIRLRTNRFL